MVTTPGERSVNASIYSHWALTKCNDLKYAKKKKNSKSKNQHLLLQQPIATYITVQTVILIGGLDSN